MAIFDVFKKFGRSRLYDLIVDSNMGAVYPATNSQYYIDSYSGNNDLFDAIGKIVRPMKTVPIIQVDADGNDKPGEMLDLINKPNPFMDTPEFIEANIISYLLFGNDFLAAELREFGLRQGKPARLDVLPPQYTDILIGDFMNPIAGYKLDLGRSFKPYEQNEVMHWKEFNPNYSTDGESLRGMSRLKPLLRPIMGSNSAYDSMVAQFQNQGAVGILSVLGVKDTDGKLMNKPTTPEQLSRLEEMWVKKWTGNSKRGSVAVTNKSHEYTKLGLSPVDMEVLNSLGLTGGKIFSVFDVPDVLMSGSSDKTYMNYAEAQKALWTNAIMPNLDAFLSKLTNFLIQYYPNEAKTKLVANYDNVAALQADKKIMVEWMVKASFSIKMIWEALGYEVPDIPNIDVPLISMGVQRIDQIGMIPGMDETEKVLKSLGINDYRHAN